MQNNGQVLMWETIPELNRHSSAPLSLGLQLASHDTFAFGGHTEAVEFHRLRDAPLFAAANYAAHTFI